MIKVILDDMLDQPVHIHKKTRLLTKILKRKFRLVLGENFPELLANLDRAVYPGDLGPLLRENFRSDKEFDNFCKENKIFWREWWDQAEHEIHEINEERRTKKALESSKY